MNFKLIPLLVVLLSFGACKKEKKVRIDEQFELIGKVQSVLISSFKGIDSSGVFIKSSSQWLDPNKTDKKLEFNKKGQLLKTSLYRNTDSLLETFSQSYKRRKLTHSEDIYFINEYTYDDEGRKSIHKEFLKPQGDDTTRSLNYAYHYDYEEDENTIVMNGVNDFGDTSLTVIDYLNEDGQVTKKETFELDASQVWEIFTYDVNGNKTSAEYFNEERGRLAKQTWNYEDKELKSHTWNAYSDGVMIFAVESLFDNKLIKKEVSWDVESDVKSTITYSYEMDKKGNWITKKIQTEEEDYFLIEREIIYF